MTTGSWSVVTNYKIVQAYTMRMSVRVHELSPACTGSCVNTHGFVPAEGLCLSIHRKFMNTYCGTVGSCDEGGAHDFV